MSDQQPKTQKTPKGQEIPVADGLGMVFPAGGRAGCLRRTGSGHPARFLSAFGGSE